jgi:hypothetical protein
MICVLMFDCDICLEVRGKDTRKGVILTSGGDLGSDVCYMRSPHVL